MVRNIIIILNLVPLAIVFFAPKRELYYSLEKRIANSGLIIDNEEIKETALGVELHHPTIIYDGAKVAEAKMIKIVSMIIYSKITIINIKNDKAMSSIFPLLPKNIIITHDILSPNILNIVAYGDFGKAKGIFDMKQMTLRMDIVEVKSIDSIKRYLKKDKNGWYYEERF